MDAPKLADAYLILKNLGKKEVGRVRKLCIAYADTAKRKTSQTKRFVEELLGLDFVPSPASFRRLAFPTASSTNYQWIQDNGMETILEYITSDSHLDSDNEGGYQISDAFRAKMRVKKLLMKFEMCSTYGGRTTAIKRLDQAIEIAEEYQLFQDLFSALLFKLFIVTQDGDKKEYESLSTRIEICQEQASADANAQLVYARYRNESRLSGVDKPARNPTFLEDIERLDRDFRVLDAHMVGFYYLQLLAEFHEGNRQYYQAAAAHAALLALVQGSKAVYSVRRLADAHASAAIGLMYTFDFDLAKQGLEHALELATPGRSLYASLQEHCAENYCYLNEPAKAHVAIQLALDWTDSDREPNTCARLHYIKAHIKFLQRDFNGAWKQAFEAKSLEHEKDGWNIGFRVLRVLIACEKGLWDHADREVYNLAQHKKRIEKKGQQLSPRDTVILAVFQQLVAHQFDFAATAQACRFELANLRAIDTPAAWKVRFHEITPVHLWFDCKLRNVSYAFSHWEEVRMWQEANRSESLTG